MNLGVKDRLVLLNTLPKEGDILSLRLIRELREKLDLTDEERLVIGLKLDPGTQTMSWKVEVADKMVKEIEIGKAERSIICQRLRQLNDQRKLLDDHVELYARFIEGEEPKD